MASRLNYQRGSLGLKLMFAVLVLVGLGTVLYLVGQQQTLTNSASADEVRLTIVPVSAQLPATVKVFVDPQGKELVFVKTVISFDKDSLRLVSEPTVSDRFPNVVRVSAMVEANSTGKVEIIAGADPGKNPVNAAVALATLKFESVAGVTISKPESDNVNFSVGEMQVVAVNQIALTINAMGTKLYTQNSISGSAKNKIMRDLGLKLSKDNGRLVANWNPISQDERPLFKNFTVVIRRSDTSELVSDPSDRNVGGALSSKNFDTASLSPGDYFVNLRAVFDQKILIQSPKKFFTITSNAKILINQ